jgi:hypothetical protein
MEHFVTTQAGKDLASNNTVNIDAKNNSLYNSSVTTLLRRMNLSLLLGVRVTHILCDAQDRVKR